MRADSERSGVTLIEMVVTIVVVAIGVSAILLLLAQGYRGSTDPQFRIKVVELGQSYMEEVFTKQWDENTPLGGGCVVPPDDTNCTAEPSAACPPDADCGPDGGETRGDFDDVDDYDGLAEGEACGDGPLRNAEGDPRRPRQRYDNYCVEVDVVTGAGDELQDVASDDAKRIDIHVTAPDDAVTTFTAYRLNF